MRADVRVFVAALAFVGLAAQSAARAEDAKQCDVPTEMLATDSVLDKVADEIKSRQLNVTVVGSGSSTLTGVDGAASAYPARLQFYLGQKLAGVTVHVATDLHLKQSAEEVAAGIGKLVKDGKPSLVVWQTGTVDALRSIDVDDFRNAMTEGIADVKSAGANIILMNPQYNPRMETVINMSTYLDAIRLVASEREVPLFDRFGIMRHWSEAGEFDFTVATRSLALARSVHDCIGRALADFIVEASHLDNAGAGNQK